MSRSSCGANPNSAPDSAIIVFMRFIAVLGLLSAGALYGQPLQDAVKARIAGFQGTGSLYAKNLDTGDSIGIRPTDPVRTASTIKLPIMLAVFDAVAKGKAKWTAPLAVPPTDKVSGSGVIGTELSDG